MYTQCVSGPGVNVTEMKVDQYMKGGYDKRHIYGKFSNCLNILCFRGTQREDEYTNSKHRTENIEI